jgi:acetyl esterase/lipase
MLEAILILIGNCLHFLDRMIYYLQMIVFHTLVCVRNCRTLTGMLVRGTRTWIVMCFRLVLFSITVAPGFYRIVLYYFTHPLILRNVEYSHNGSRNRNLLDIYLPIPCDAATRLKHNIKEYSDGAPIVIFVSGGAWTIGYKMWCSFVGKQFASLGFLTIAPDYRNFPQGDIKDMMDDVRQAVLWTYNNAHRFGGNPNKIVLAGQSAGAHISMTILVEEFLQKKLLQQKREQFKLKQQAMLQHIFTQHPIAELTKKHKQEFSEVVRENEEAAEASLNATMTSAFDDSSTFLTYSVYPLKEKQNQSIADHVQRDRIEHKTDSSMIFQENPMFLPVSTEQPAVDGTWYAPLQQQQDKSQLSAFSPALSTPSSAVSKGFHTPATTGKHTIPIDTDASMSRLFPDDNTSSEKRSKLKPLLDRHDEMLLGHIVRDEEIVATSIHQSDQKWSNESNRRRINSGSVAFASDVSPIPSAASRTDSPYSSHTPAPATADLAEELENATFETISDKIQVFVAVSGPFNLHALKSHLHHRGLDSSILSWICRGDLCQYSPTVQLYRYVNDELDKATKDPIVAGTSYKPPAPYSAECEEACSAGPLSYRNASTNEMTIAQDKKEMNVNLHTTIPFTVGPSGLTRPVLLLNPNAYPSTMKFANTTTATAISSSGKNIYTNSSHYLSLKHESKSSTTSKRQTESRSTPNLNDQDVGINCVGEKSSKEQKKSTFFEQLITLPIKFMTDEEYWSANHTDELPYLHLHEEFNHQHSITHTKQSKVSPPEKNKTNNGVNSSSSSPVDGNTDRDSESDNDHPSNPHARVYKPSTQQPLNEKMTGKEVTKPVRPQDTHLLPVKDTKLSDFPSIVVFHGTKDDSIPVSISDELVYLLRTHGADVSYKVYENWSHTDMILEAPLIGNMRCVKDIQKVVYQYTDLLQPISTVNPIIGVNAAVTEGGSTSIRTRRRAKSDPNIDIRSSGISGRAGVGGGKSVSFAPNVATFGESIGNAKQLLGEEQITPKFLVRIARHINPF